MAHVGEFLHLCLEMPGKISQEHHAIQAMKDVTILLCVLETKLEDGRQPSPSTTRLTFMQER